MLSPGDSQRVADLMRETAAAELLPRFRTLSKDEIRFKRPGDVVTVADVASEQRLAVGLAEILPGVPVVGEEAVEKEPGLVDLIGRPGEACWIVDPLDGTANFAAGKDRFAMIICLVQDRSAVAGWILDVPRGRMGVAHKGQGVAIDGMPVHGRPADRPLIGFVGPKARKEFDRQLSPAVRGQLGHMSASSCAGLEYLDILSGQVDFSLYRTTKPWDHAAGTLMLAEAGGGSTHLQTLAQVRALFEAVRLPLLAGLPAAT